MRGGSQEMAGKSPDIIQQYLEEVEAAAEEVMTAQQEVVTLDRRRNTNREALRHLRTNTAATATATTAQDPNRSWICVGNMFLRMPRGFVVESIDKEQKQLDTEINNLRNSLRGKVNKLNDLEGKEDTRGTSLKPLTQEEWRAVSQALGK